MSLNVPDYDEDLLSFGPGVIYLGTVGSTPSMDIGAINEGMELSHETEFLNAVQGSESNVIRQFIENEFVTFSFEGLEWRIENFDEYLGAGTVADGDLSYGGDVTNVEASLRLLHKMPPIPREAGGYEQTWATIDIWRAHADGSMAIEFFRDVHDFPVNLIALPSSEDWAGDDLEQGEEYYRINLKTHIIGVTLVSSDLTIPTNPQLCPGLTFGYELEMFGEAFAYPGETFSSLSLELIAEVSAPLGLTFDAFSMELLSSVGLTLF